VRDREAFEEEDVMAAAMHRPDKSCIGAALVQSGHVIRALAVL
jgi:hypothetical protein